MPVVVAFGDVGELVPVVVVLDVIVFVVIVFVVIIFVVIVFVVIAVISPLIGDVLIEVSVVRRGSAERNFRR